MGMKSLIKNLLKHNKKFGYMINTQLSNFPDQTLKFLCGAITNNKCITNVIMNNPCKIYKAIINAGYSEQNAFGIVYIAFMDKIKLSNIYQNWNCLFVSRFYCSVQCIV